VGDVQSFLQGLPALLGVIVGATGTYLATSATERARWRRVQSVRWDEKRASAYEEYAHALKQVISAALPMAAFRDANREGDSLPSEDESTVLAAAEDQRTVKWEAVLLLGSNEVVIAARKWHQSVFRPQRLAYGMRSDMSLAEAIDAISQGRRHFYEAAKRDIGIEVGPSPEAYEWQLRRTTQSGLDDADDPYWYRSQGRAEEDNSNIAK
jgi:hypothetical protein